MITLAATASERLAARQENFHRLASGPASAAALDRDPELGLLIDRLGNRLGVRNLLRAVPREPSAGACGACRRPLSPPQGGGWDEGLAGPVRLLAAPEPVEVMAEVPDGPPVRFRWRGRGHRVARADGPERLAPEWWRPTGASGRTRDYYRLEDENGTRFWIYRDGLYTPAAGEPDTEPRWYLHGFFA